MKEELQGSVEVTQKRSEEFLVGTQCFDELFVE